MKQRTSGQVLVEFALILPAVILLLLVIVQTAMLFNAQYLATYASFCGCRSAIVHAKTNPLTNITERPDIFAQKAARLVLASSLKLSSQLAGVKGLYMGTEYQVTVTVPVKNIVPGLNLLLPFYPVTATTRFKIE